MSGPQQLDLLDYPNSPGFARGRDTSRDAAEAIASRAPTLRALVFEELKRQPQTVHEVAYSLGRSVPSVQPRVSELEKLGLIDDSGIRRRNAVSGKMAIVWRSLPPA